ncbi:1-(5-phosphoribosyl)-5- ((5-phosphoribosylamino)methylideneamino)imidazole-4-carboxamide isomerase HIS6 [Sporobolomyces koalae]|uniref:1-(5-phosphoribosyl)-5- ((5-phosphoribosylamino)methylideneamino)imidazole-4- carboxamide isomerase HIS6 n=1 Tax=Sporobolomyces koalae TaxID=500713 RepID=UPI00316BDFF6
MPRSVFRPCIDLHNGQVKQIVGGTLDTQELRTNFVSAKPSEFYAGLYKDHHLTGGHVIKLGPGNDEAAKNALQAWPNGLHVGGGITEDNAQDWIDAGAEKVIVTSYLFPSAKFDLERLQRIAKRVGKERLVVDVSCRKREDKWVVAMNRWQDLTDMQVNKESLDLLAEYCSEFLIHAADVEGLCQGIDEQLVERLGEWVTIPTTYAGGAKSVDDLATVDELSQGKVDLTYGSALDIFGGSQVQFDQLVEYNRNATTTVQ